MNAIVAVYSDWGIGAGGTQPVVVKADRRHFVELTRAAAVIVGRKTLEDFPGGRPLKGRYNIVLTRADITIDGALVVHSPEEAAQAARGRESAFVLGGASVFSQLLPWVDRVYVTMIYALPPSDVYFENLDKSPEWRCADHGGELSEDGLKYRFMTYERIKKA